MRQERPLSKCCSQPIAAEAISLVGKAKTTFARVPVCLGCSRLLGEPKPLYGCPIRPLEAKSWGTSWSLMVEHRRERIGAPLYFEDRNSVLVPEGYSGEGKFQPGLDDGEVPF